jgi:hypothetical protein
VISRWNSQYHQGKFFENTDPDTTSLKIRVGELERLMGELTMDNFKEHKIIIKLMMTT